MIREEAYRKLELEGAFATTRQEWLAAATVYLLEFLVSAKGIKFAELEEQLERGVWSIVKKHPKTFEEIEKERSEYDHNFLLRLGHIYGIREE